MAASTAAGGWPDESRPRSVAVPAPMGGGSRTPRGLRPGAAGREETLRAMRDKLAEYQAENTLLGGLVRELKGERDGLHKRLQAATKQHSEASGKAAAASAQADALVREQQRLKSEVSRLTDVLHSHSLRLQKAKQHQQELEDVALDMRAELQDVQAAREAAQRAADAAAQRVAAAEAKLHAAGLGALPKMGPTAEQLVINSTQRVKELADELTEAKQAHARALAGVQQQLDAAQAEARDARQQLQQRGAQLQELQAQVLSLQQQLVAAQQTVVDSKELAQTRHQLQQLQQGMASSSLALERQVGELQAQLSACEAAHAAALSEQQQVQAAAQRERQEMAAALAAARQQESAARLAAGEAASKAERLRGELLRCVNELQAQLAVQAEAGQQQRQTQQTLRALEEAAAGARAEATEARQQLVELATASLAELREQVAGEAAAISGLPDSLSALSLPAPVGSYIKVLEHAIVDCEQRCKQLLADNAAAAERERKARSSLAAAREAQATAERGLQQQTQRLLAAERMRLADLKDQQSLERRLALVQQECWSLRDALINGGRGGCSAGPSRNSSPVRGSSPVRSSFAPMAAAAAAAAGPEHRWQVPAAADAGNAAPGAAASTAAIIKGYQAKLAELRVVREHLMAKQLASVGAAAAYTTGAGGGSMRPAGQLAVTPCSPQSSATPTATPRPAPGALAAHALAAAAAAETAGGAAEGAADRASHYATPPRPLSPVAGLSCASPAATKQQQQPCSQAAPRGSGACMNLQRWQL